MNDYDTDPAQLLRGLLERDDLRRGVKADVEVVLAEVERLRGRVLALESQGAVNVVARPLKRDLDRACAERDRYREFVEDIAEGWVGNLQNRARGVLDRRDTA
jgi:hypothetical protein